MGGHRLHTWRVGAGLVLLAACTGGPAEEGGSGGSVPPTTLPERPSEAFYQVPDPLPPGPPGALIRATPIAGLELRTWRDTGHFDIPKVAAADVAAWISDRLADQPPRTTCPP